MHESWRRLLAEEFEKPYFKTLLQFVRTERSKGTVFPPSGQVFNAFNLPYDQVKVVIVGQDPYHNFGQAHGLSFSVPEGVAVPPSLCNIFLERKADLGLDVPKHGNLTAWAQQGVLLLNTVLTVRAHSPESHRKRGWETFTNRVLELLDSREVPMVFILWGRYAR